MLLKIHNFFLVLLLLNSSCNLFIKEEQLGNNCVLSEYDNVDRRILHKGFEMVPMTVTHYAYDSNWIIAKSDSRNGGNERYWIIDKSFNVNLVTDIDSSEKIIKSHMIGPVDLNSFEKELKSRNIKLTLKKI